MTNIGYKVKMRNTVYHPRELIIKGFKNGKEKTHNAFKTMIIYIH